MSVEQTLLAKRDGKAIPHLNQYAPVWIVDQKIIYEDDAVQFNAVFQHPAYGWVSRRYRYDSFNDVLYHKGQTTLSETEALAVQETEPYLLTMVGDIPNAYGG